MTSGAARGSLLAVSDLHVAFPENRSIVESLRPSAPEDWLIVAGDVAELFADVEATLRTLATRFRQVIWVPGNHELWTHPSDPVRLRGVARYSALVEVCRQLGVVTPEDAYPIWTGESGPVVIVPIFQLYDYSFRIPGIRSTNESLRRAYEAGVVCSDEYLLHPDPFPSRQAWCNERVSSTQLRLDQLDPMLPTVLASHWPLVRRPTDALLFPEFAQWCGTVQTADWHVRYRARAAVYGHLHIPRSSECDGVRFEEVSLGYPREWGWRSGPITPVRQILGPP